jgi:hypothetical protein
MKNKKPTKSERDNHAEKYPLHFDFRVNEGLKEQLEHEAKASGCSPATWLRQAIRGEVVGTKHHLHRRSSDRCQTDFCPTVVPTVGIHTNPDRHPETQRRLNEIFPARPIGFVPNPEHACGREDLLLNENRNVNSSIQEPSPIGLSTPLFSDVPRLPSGDTDWVAYKALKR